MKLTRLRSSLGQPYRDGPAIVDLAVRVQTMRIVATDFPAEIYVNWALLGHHYLQHCTGYR